MYKDVSVLALVCECLLLFMLLSMLDKCIPGCLYEAPSLLASQSRSEYKFSTCLTVARPSRRQAGSDICHLWTCAMRRWRHGGVTQPDLRMENTPRLRHGACG